MAMKGGGALVPSPCGGLDIGADKLGMVSR